MLPTSRGARAVARRSFSPYQVWASAIQHVLVEGTATVNGASWLPASLDGELLKLMALPVARPHPRYAALDGGVLLAAARVARGAPLRKALYDVDGAPRPFEAPTLTLATEVARVDALADALRPDLLRLVDEQVLDPRLLTTASTIVDERGAELGTSTNNCLDAVLQGTVDHGLARWLGFLDNDVLAPVDDKITARVVTTVFAPDWAELLRTGLLATIPLDAVVPDLPALQALYPDFDALGDLDGTVAGPFLDIGVMAACSTGRLLDTPPPPTTVSITDRPTRTTDVEAPALSAWVPRTPPDAARATRVVVGELLAGSALALARDDLDGSGPLVRNAASAAAGFHQPLVGGMTADRRGRRRTRHALGARLPAGRRALPRRPGRLVRAVERVGRDRSRRRRTPGAPDPRRASLGHARPSGRRRSARRRDRGDHPRAGAGRPGTRSERALVAALPGHRRGERHDHHQRGDRRPVEPAVRAVRQRRRTAVAPCPLDDGHRERPLGGQRRGALGTVRRPDVDDLGPPPAGGRRDRPDAALRRPPRRHRPGTRRVDVAGGEPAGTLPRLLRRRDDHAGPGSPARHRPPPCWPRSTPRPTPSGAPPRGPPTPMCCRATPSR